jgi:hypothetical protein
MADQVAALVVGPVIRIQEILDLEIHHLLLQAKVITAEQELQVEMEEEEEVLAV